MTMLAGSAYAQDKPKAPKPVMSAASQVGGSLFVTYVAAWIPVVAPAFDNLSISQEPGGSSQNVILVNKGQTDFGITASSQGYLGYHGMGWAKGKKYQNMAALHPAFPTNLAVVTLAKSGINSLADLKGKQLGVGAPGGGSDVIAHQLMDFLNVEPSRYVNASWEDTGGLLRDGLVDAIFYIAGHPAGFLQELEVNQDLKFLRLTSDQIDAFNKKYPYYPVVTLKSETYKGLTEDYKTVGQMAYMFGSPDLPDDFVTHLLDAVYAGTDKLAKAHPLFAGTVLDNVQGIPVPFHRAAKKYYEDHGVKMNVAPAPAAQ